MNSISDSTQIRETVIMNLQIWKKVQSIMKMQYGQKILEYIPPDTLDRLQYL